MLFVELICLFLAAFLTLGQLTTSGNIQVEVQAMLHADLEHLQPNEFSQHFSLELGPSGPFFRCIKDLSQDICLLPWGRACVDHTAVGNLCRPFVLPSCPQVATSSADHEVVCMNPPSFVLAKASVCHVICTTKNMSPASASSTAAAAVVDGPSFAPDHDVFQTCRVEFKRGPKSASSWGRFYFFVPGTIS